MSENRIFAAANRRCALNLAEAVETGYFLLPELPGELSALRIPGVRGRVTSVSSPYANVVGAAHLDPESVDATIAAVVRFFGEAGLAFGWRVGPASRPRELGQRLEAAGLVRQDDILGLRCDDLRIQLPIDPALTIRAAGPEDLAGLIDLVEEAFPYHAEWAPILGKAYLARPAESETTVYLAFADGDADPAGFGCVTQLPNQPVAMLSGAATRARYRRRGVYSSLLAHRLHAADESGAVAAVLQAVPVSAAACLKMGFIHLCQIEHYTMVGQHETG